jgi:hypothetical protein
MKPPDAFLNFAYWLIGSLTDAFYTVRDSPVGRRISRLLGRLQGTALGVILIALCAVMILGWIGIFLLR